MKALNTFQNILNFLVTKSIKFPKSVLLLLAIFLGILVLNAKPFKLLITLDDLLSPNFKSYQAYEDLKDNFEVMPSVFVMIKKESSALDHKDLCSLKKWIDNTNFNTPNLYYSISPFNLRHSVYLEKNNERFQTLLFKKTIETNCELQLKYKTDATLSKVGKTPWDNILTNADYSDFAVNFNFQENGELNFQSKVLPKHVDKLKKSWFANSELSQKFKAFFIGEASYHHEMSLGLKKNMRLNLIICVIVVLLFRLFLGTWASSFIFLGSLVLSTTILFSIMAATGTPIDILNNALFLLLTVSSMGDFIFISNYQSKNTEKHWKHSFYSNTLPCFFTSLTTFVGFISLYSSDLEIVKRLGLWAAVSAVIEWVVTFTIIPAILSFKKQDYLWVNPKKIISLIQINKLSAFKLPKVITYILLLTYLLIPTSLNNLNISDVPLELFEKNNPYRIGMNYLESSRGYTGDVSLIFSNFNRETENKTLLKKLESHPNVVKIESPYTMIEYLTNGLTESHSRVVKRSLRSSPNYKRLISEPDARAIIYLKSTDLRSINEFSAYVNNSLCKKGSCSLSGLHVAYSDFALEVPKTLIRSFIISLVIVFLILLILSYVVKKIPLFKLFVTSFWGVSIVICLISLFQIKINFITCVVISTLVGLTGDNAIHFILNRLKGMDLNEGVLEKSNASVLTAIVMAISSLTFIFSYFNPPKVFGVLLFAGFLLSLLGDLYMLKSIMSNKGPQK